jgi:RNA polymerase sigma factor (sigma-70 family)
VVFVMTMNATITTTELLAHTAWLQRLARRLVDPASADDLVQETWATAVRSQPDRDRPLRPWLGTVLRNLAISRARTARRLRAKLPLLTADEAPLPSAEELYAYHEAQRLVAEAVTALEEPFRSTVLLRYGQEIDAGEIARRQGIPAGTVRWRLKRGLDQMRAALDARHGDDRKKWTILLAPLTKRPLDDLGAAAAARDIGAGQLAGKLALLTVLAAVALVVGVRARPAQRASAPVASARIPRFVTPGAGTVAPGPALARPSGGAGAAGEPAPTPLDVIEARQRASEPGDAPVRGNPKAIVAMAFFGDLQDPMTARFATSTMAALEATYPNDLRIVWRHLPLAFHTSASVAAEAALAAHEQGKFWPMHDLIFAHQDRLDPATLEAHAQALGLDVAKWKASFDSGKWKPRIDADLALAKAARLAATPAFLINGEPLLGARPIEQFKERIDAAIAKVRGTPAPAPLAETRNPTGAPDPAPLPGEDPLLAVPAVILPDDQLGAPVRIRFATANAPVRGNPNGPIEILYFTPLAIKENRAVVAGLLASYGDHIKVVAKVTVRLASATDDSTLLAEAAHYAQAQGKFWPFHDAFAAEYPRPDRARILAVAKQVGLDEADLAAALEEGRYRSVVKEEIDLARSAHIGDAGLVVNGRLAESSVAAVQLVENGLRRAGVRVAVRSQSPTLTPATAPANGAYDPQRLLQTLSPRQLFDLEQRDDPWANAVEKALAPLIESDLLALEPKLAGTTLACHFALCRLRWQPGRGDPRLIAEAARALYADDGGRTSTAELYLLLRDSPRASAADSIARLESRRRSLLFNHRTGRPTNALPLPFERISQR